MRTGVALTGLGLTLALALAPAARATTVYIGLQENGVNGGSRTTVATSTSGSAVYGFPPSTYGTFTVNDMTAQDNSVLGGDDILNSTSLNTSSSTAGTLKVWVSTTGLTSVSGLQDFASSFTANSLTGDIASVQEITYIDNSDAAYGTAEELSSHTFTSGPSTALPPLTLYSVAAPFSATEEYIITSTGRGNANLTEDLSVPEPTSLALLGSGLIGLAFYRRRVLQPLG